MADKIIARGNRDKMLSVAHLDDFYLRPAAIVRNCERRLMFTLSVDQLDYSAVRQDARHSERRLCTLFRPVIVHVLTVVTSGRCGSGDYLLPWHGSHPYEPDVPFGTLVSCKTTMTFPRLS